MLRKRRTGDCPQRGEHTRVKAPRDRPEARVFVRPHIRAVLDALRYADQHPGRREWVPGEPEWRSSRELTAWLRTRRGGGKTPRIFFADDLAAAVQFGLVERRDEQGGIIYRLTSFGRDVRPLVGRDPAVFAAPEPVKPTGTTLHPVRFERPESQLPDGHAYWYGYPLNMLGSGN
jgi:hypothetical protein